MANDFRSRLRNLNTQTRWLISLAGAFVLLLIAGGCSMIGLMMMIFSTDACSSLPSWLDAYLILPPAILALTSIIGPLMFGFRRRLPWVLGVLIGGWAIGIALYIVWLPLVATQC